MIAAMLAQTFPSVSGVAVDSNFVVGWGTLSLINAGLAQSKARSGLLWWAFSLILGPIATFLIVVLPKVERKLPETLGIAAR